MNAWNLAIVAAEEAKAQEEHNAVTFLPVDSLALAWAGILSTAP
jgi:hypothetical protein